MDSPDGRTLNYNYNSGVDSNISRVSSISDGGGTYSGQTLAQYGYLGTSTVVQQMSPLPGGGSLDLSYVSAGGSGYSGLDAFGNVADQKWTLDAGAVGQGSVVDEFKDA